MQFMYEVFWNLTGVKSCLQSMCKDLKLPEVHKHLKTELKKNS